MKRITWDYPQSKIKVDFYMYLNEKIPYDEMLNISAYINGVIFEEPHTVGITKFY